MDPYQAPQLALAQYWISRDKPMTREIGFIGLITFPALCVVRPCFAIHRAKFLQKEFAKLLG